MTHCFSESFL